MNVYLWFNKQTRQGVGFGLSEKPTGVAREYELDSVVLPEAMVKALRAAPHEVTYLKVMVPATEGQTPEIRVVRPQTTDPTTLKIVVLPINPEVYPGANIRFYVSRVTPWAKHPEQQHHLVRVEVDVDDLPETFYLSICGESVLNALAQVEVSSSGKPVKTSAFGKHQRSLLFNEAKVVLLRCAPHWRPVLYTEF